MMNMWLTTEREGMKKLPMVFVGLERVGSFPVTHSEAGHERLIYSSFGGIDS